MKNQRKKIGNINYEGQAYEVYWELYTNLVWIVDNKGSWFNSVMPKLSEKMLF